jgi:hypothetical protein
MFLRVVGSRSERETSENLHTTNLWANLPQGDVRRKRIITKNKNTWNTRFIPRFSDTTTVPYFLVEVPTKSLVSFNPNPPLTDHKDSSEVTY